MNEPYEGRAGEWQTLPDGTKAMWTYGGKRVEQRHRQENILGYPVPVYTIQGEAETLPSGMNREPTEGKVNYLLLRDGPMLKRWAEHLTRAIPKRGKRNWMLAHTEDDLERFKEGLCRHVEQFLADERDEDHAAAIMFAVNGIEYVREKLREEG